MNLGYILVATDFSEAARRAEQRAAKLAQQLDSEIRLIHVLPEEGVLRRIFDREGVDHAQMRRCAEQALESSCKALERTYDIEVSWNVLTGSATRSIGEAIESLSADLLVIGARGEHAVSHDKSGLGGTAVKLLSQIKIPLLLVRRTVEDFYSTIVVAIGVEPSARRVLNVVQAFCGNAQCHLIHASQAPFAERLRQLDVSTSAIDTYSREQFSAAEQLLKNLIGESLCKDRLRPLVVRGDPKATLSREIERLEPELVVLGQHDRQATQDDRPGVGSMAARIAMSTYCDILQVP